MFACAPVNRFVGQILGTGSFAWMTQLWPFADQATQAGKSFYATGQATDQAVAEGDEICILESMKMEIPVVTEVPGVVREIHVEPGQSVREGDLIARIDET